ncbi:hypothetical protein [Nocardia heshunensis]
MPIPPTPAEREWKSGRGSITGRVVGTPDRIIMPALQPVWFTLLALTLMCEQSLIPGSVLPTLGAMIVAAGAQHRLVHSRYRKAARFFRWIYPVEYRQGMLLRLVDDDGRKWQSKFMPVMAMEVLANDLVFTEGRVTRRGDLSIWGLTNIRTGTHRTSRMLAVWPIVVVSVAIIACTAVAVL